MQDAWSRSIAQLSEPNAPPVHWPAERCRQVSRWPAERPPRKSPPAKVRVPGSDETDAAILQALRARDVTTRDLAHVFAMPRRTMFGRLARLHELGLIRHDREGVWQVVA